ncbi:uncharacterized protein LOC135139065 [Zophobas morio]|uniref:uncharacterized protein LOC135139065 n=1 Tax=Zophobas morio TaxID=2755281 RepID=UPI003082F249
MADVINRNKSLKKSSQNRKTITAYLEKNGTKKSAELDEIQTLQKTISDLEARLASLVFEKKKSNIELEHEKRKVTQLKVQLQLVKANHVIQYLPKKSADVRKLVEVRDKGVQTWGGVLCRACLDTEQLRNKLERTQDLYNDCIVIKRSSFDSLNTTVKTLKQQVDKEIGTDEEIVENLFVKPQILQS